MIVTIRLPWNSGRAATLAAAHMLAPLLMPRHDPLFAGQPPGPFEGVLVGHVDRRRRPARCRGSWAQSRRRCLGCLCWAGAAAADHGGVLAGSTAIALKSGFFGLMKRATPVIVPPVPTPATMASICWPVSSQISGPVVAS